ncbi:MAG TPA: nicotinate-nucleotide adenylyltransferase [Candidatus Manganitrophaceae bacterium]|nr:nicotinate-nucleotide adenylyltransferase [Candidatus Manganitrophaceae bacterium]
MRIGLLGGTFNPIHNGHLQIAEEVQKKLSLDRLLFIPSGDPPHKKREQIPSAEHRLEMTRLALFPYPHFEVCDIEVKRPGKSYSIQTVTELKRLYPSEKLFFIIGTDAFFDLPTWREAERLLTLCDFAILSRPGHPFSRLPDLPLLRSIDRNALMELDRGGESVYTFRIGPEASLHFIRIAPIAVSASEIRKRLKKREETKNLLPESVSSYIIKNKLYQEDKDF